MSTNPLVESYETYNVYVPSWSTARREKFETAYFWQFLPRFSAVLAHPVAIIAKIRQFLYGVWTAVQRSFLPVLHCHSSAMHLCSS